MWLACWLKCSTGSASTRESTSFLRWMPSCGSWKDSAAMSVAKHVPYRTTPCPASPCNRNYAGPSTPPCTNAANDPGGELPAAALAERVGDFNLSMDPWERMLHRRGGHHTCTRRYCLSNDIFSYDLRTLLFPPLVGALLCLLGL